MPSHLSTIGFDVRTEADFEALSQRVAERAESIPVKAGEYLAWTGNCGAELWLQADPDGALVGLHPHFTGFSSIRVGLTARVRRDDDTALDGAFHAWADPEPDRPGDSGCYPFVFDAPDAATYGEFALPRIATAQIAAFAHEIESYASAKDFHAAQEGQEVPFAAQSFFPSGLFTPDLENNRPPDANAIFTGHVLEADERKNAMTGTPFYWALVDSFGGKYDVVIDPTLLEQVPRVGGVLSGSFWLSGRLTSLPTRKRSWFERIVGRRRGE